MKVTTLGIDLAKNVFQLHGINSLGKVVLQKAVQRRRLLQVMGKLAPVFSWHGKHAAELTTGDASSSEWVTPSD